MVRIYRDYIELLSDRLGDLLKETRYVDPALRKALDEALQDASDLAFSRVLSAPEISHRLIWKPSTVRERARFVLDALYAEQAREGKSLYFDAETWTALGDVGFFPDGRVIHQPKLVWDMPLDFGSPYARAVDLGNGDTITPRDDFTKTEIERVLALLNAACDGIGRTNSLILDFTVRFNKALVLQKDPAEPYNFTSGSTGQFVGRSFLTNPHLDTVNEIGIAEGIVHEAIHSLLYMQERKKDWVKVVDLYHPTQVLISPWTGSRLALRPFMQACFVWYGLLHLWCDALLAGGFDDKRIRSRIQVCLGGFLKGPLIDRLTPWRDGISDELVESIEAMQENVTRTMAEMA